MTLGCRACVETSDEAAAVILSEILSKSSGNRSIVTDLENEG